MGLGKWNGKRHLPISKYKGSWADTVNKEPLPKKEEQWVTLIAKKSPEGLGDKSKTSS